RGRVAQLAHVYSLDLVLAPAEQPGPGWIDRDETAREGRDPEQVLGTAPDAVGFARALREVVARAQQQPLLARELPHEIEKQRAGRDQPAQPPRIPADRVARAARGRQQAAAGHDGEREAQPQKEV